MQQILLGKHLLSHYQVHASSGVCLLIDMRADEKVDDDAIRSRTLLICTA